MELYFACFCIGFFGLLGMAMLGLGHHGHSGGHGGHGGHSPVRGSSGHVHAVRGAASRGAASRGARSGREPSGNNGTGPSGAVGVVAVLPAHPTRADASADPTHPETADGGGISTLLGWLSPRVLLSLCLGFGATGLLVHGRLGTELTLMAAAAGALVFEAAAVGPMWNLCFRFASDPARTLETAVFEEALAVTNFDAAGSGLIAIDLDGQHIQVLGNLSPAELSEGRRVRAGDRLIIEAVDAKRNACTVSRMQHGAVAP